MRKHYSTEFKLWTISLASEKGMSLHQAEEYCSLSNYP
ncbi:Transposase [Avibacterium endocarditidis]